MVVAARTLALMYCTGDGRSCLVPGADVSCVQVMVAVAWSLALMYPVYR
jgi:hypothetical protein